MLHLWEIEHPYYCSSNNYFSNDCCKKYETWKEFYEEEGGSDFDLNLLFRFDWRTPESGWVEEGGDILELFYVQQRKGLFRSVIIKINRDEEEDVIKFLTSRFRWLLKLWSPLPDAVAVN